MHDAVRDHADELRFHSTPVMGIAVVTAENKNAPVRHLKYVRRVPFSRVPADMGGLSPRLSLVDAREDTPPASGHDQDFVPRVDDRRCARAKIWNARRLDAGP